MNGGVKAPILCAALTISIHKAAAFVCSSQQFESSSCANNLKNFLVEKRGKFYKIKEKKEVLSAVKSFSFICHFEIVQEWQTTKERIRVCLSAYAYKQHKLSVIFDFGETLLGN